MNTGKTLFAQLMEFLPWKAFSRVVTRYGGDTRVRTLSCGEQFRAMAFAQLTYRGSVDLANTVYALDSTTIDLCLSVFPWADFRATKAAVKMHTLLDLRGNIPSFIHVSNGKLHDVHALDMLLPEAGSIYVMDRGYLDFARLYRLHRSGAFFVTRAKSNLKAHRLYSGATDRASRVMADQTIALDGLRTQLNYPDHLRRIRFRDPGSRKTLVFLTNHTDLPASTVCSLYESRWQVELFFKWTKQHLRIKRFYGTSENYCVGASHVFVDLDWYVGLRLYCWLRRKRPKARASELWGLKQPQQPAPDEAPLAGRLGRAAFVRLDSCRPISPRMDGNA